MVAKNMDVSIHDPRANPSFSSSNSDPNSNPNSKLSTPASEISSGKRNFNEISSPPMNFHSNPTNSSTNETSSNTPKKMKNSDEVQYPPCPFVDDFLGAIEPDIFHMIMLPFLTVKDVARLSETCKTLRNYTTTEVGSWCGDYYDEKEKAEKEGKNRLLLCSNVLDLKQSAKIYDSKDEFRHLSHGVVRSNENLKLSEIDWLPYAEGNSAAFVDARALEFKKTSDHDFFKRVSCKVAKKMCVKLLSSVIDMSKAEIVRKNEVGVFLHKTMPSLRCVEHFSLAFSDEMFQRVSKTPKVNPVNNNRNAANDANNRNAAIIGENEHAILRENEQLWQEIRHNDELMRQRGLRMPQTRLGLRIAEAEAQEAAHIARVNFYRRPDPAVERARAQHRETMNIPLINQPMNQRNTPEEPTERVVRPERRQILGKRVYIYPARVMQKSHYAIEGSNNRVEDGPVTEKIGDDSLEPHLMSQAAQNVPVGESFKDTKRRLKRELEGLMRENERRHEHSAVEKRRGRAAIENIKEYNQWARGEISRPDLEYPKSPKQGKFPKLEKDRVYRGTIIVYNGFHNSILDELRDAEGRRFSTRIFIRCSELADEFEMNLASSEANICVRMSESSDSKSKNVRQNLDESDSENLDDIITNLNGREIGTGMAVSFKVRPNTRPAEACDISIVDSDTSRKVVNAEKSVSTSSIVDRATSSTSASAAGGGGDDGRGIIPLPPWRTLERLLQSSAMQVDGGDTEVAGNTDFIGINDTRNNANTIDTTVTTTNNNNLPTQTADDPNPLAEDVNDIISISDGDDSMAVASEPANQENDDEPMLVVNNEGNNHDILLDRLGPYRRREMAAIIGNALGGGDRQQIFREFGLREMLRREMDEVLDLEFRNEDLLIDLTNEDLQTEQTPPPMQVEPRHPRAQIIRPDPERAEAMLEAAFANRDAFVRNIANAGPGMAQEQRIYTGPEDEVNKMFDLEKALFFI